MKSLLDKIVEGSPSYPDVLVGTHNAGTLSFSGKGKITLFTNHVNGTVSVELEIDGCESGAIYLGSTSSSFGRPKLISLSFENSFNILSANSAIRYIAQLAV